VVAALLATSCAGEPATVTTSPAGVTAKLIEVFDGDTLRVVIDGGEDEVRLLGINAPEQEECFGSRSREAAARLLGAEPLLLEAATERDQFGRLLAYAYAGGRLVNLALLEEGYALAVQGDHPRLAEFLEADEQAYSAGSGMWVADACGPSSGLSLSVVDIEPDPAGPDEDDLNGEWVLVANTGDQQADLSGWALRDESSEHRYRFPAGALLGPGEQVAVHTGCGHDGAGDRYWCADGPAWNNGGDTALLLDPRGNVAARLRYSG